MMAQIDIEPLKEYLAMAIAFIIETKEQQGTAPLHATTQDIMGMLSDNAKRALNEMVTSGLLTFHRTINGVSFEFTPPKRTVLRQGT